MKDPTPDHLASTARPLCLPSLEHEVEGEGVGDVVLGVGRLDAILFQRRTQLLSLELTHPSQQLPGSLHTLALMPSTQANAETEPNFVQAEPAYDSTVEVRHNVSAEPFVPQRGHGLPFLFRITCNSATGCALSA